MSGATISALRDHQTPKGDPLETARLAGIMAAKKTADLIPLCHPLPLTHIDVQARIEETGVSLEAEVSTNAQTGVEMEALTAVSIAALLLVPMMLPPVVVGVVWRLMFNSDIGAINGTLKTAGVAPTPYSTSSALTPSTGTGAQFELQSPSGNLPFEVQWADSANRTSGQQLVAGTARSGFVSTANNHSCNNSPAAASLIVLLRAFEIERATAGGYSGQLTLIIAPM